MNEAGEAAFLTVVPTTSPQASATTDLVHRLRDDVVPSVSRAESTSTLAG